LLADGVGQEQIIIRLAQDINVINIGQGVLHGHSDRDGREGVGESGQEWLNLD